MNFTNINSRWSLKIRLAFLFGIFSIIACGVVSTVLSISSKKSILEQEEKLLSAVRDAKIETLQTLFKNFGQNTESLASAKYFQDAIVAIESVANGTGIDFSSDSKLADSDYYKNIYGKHSESFKESLQQYGVNDFFAVLMTGTVLVGAQNSDLVGHHLTNGRLKGTQLSKCFKTALDNPKKLHFEDLDVLDKGRVPTVLACKVIESKYHRDGYPKGSAMGVLVIELNWEQALAIIKDIETLVPGGNMYVLGQDSKTRIAKELQKPYSTEVAKNAAAHDNSAFFGQSESNEVMVAVKKINFFGLDWTVFLEAPTHIILEPVRSLYALTFFFGIMISLILAVIGYVIANTISKSLAKDAVSLEDKARDLSAMSSDLSEASHSLATSATEQASSLEESVAILEEISSLIRQNSSSSSNAASKSDLSRQGIESGRKEIILLVSAMHEMEVSSKKIEEIINVIEDIAFQTNLLALNAAVEAARAGEQGKGFAVVADAVRSLALKSTTAAKDIADLIHQSVDSIQKGVSSVEKNNVLLSTVFDSVTSVAEMNAQIARSIKEQVQGIDQINFGMNQLDTSAQSNAATSEQISSSAASLEEAAKDLQSLVFNLKGTVLGNGNDVGENKETAA